MYKKIEPQILNTSDIGNLNLGDKKLTIQMFFLPYSVWSEGKVDWADADIPKIECVEGTIIRF